MRNRVFVVDACRTPIGKTGGGLSKYTEAELLTVAIRALIERNSQMPMIEEIIVGCCFCQEKRNLAKKAALAVSLPYSIPAVTINRTCASSMEALVQGYYRIVGGDADVVLIGGVENMNSNPNVMKLNIQNARKFLKVGQPLMPLRMDEGDLVESIGMAVDIMARNRKISRCDQDYFAAESHAKAENALRKSIFCDEVIPCYSYEKELIIVDEGVNTSLNESDYKQAMSLYFKDGSITKYNAAPISDGASAMILVSERVLKKYGLTPIAEMISSALVGVQPSKIGIAAADAYLMLRKKAQLDNDDIDLIECNEAYAAQVLACIERAKWDRRKVNIYGGSLAIGHPLGCSGLRICTTLIYGMRRKGVQYGVATMCAGGGMGQAVLFRRDREWE